MSYTQQFEQQRFAQVPIEILLDERLTNSDRLALIAILCYTNARSCSTTPLTLATLAEVTGLALATLSRSTAALVAAGYLEKKQAGFNEPNVYRVTTPEYKTGELRVITDKKMSNEEWAKKQDANREKRENTLVRMTDVFGEVQETTWAEIKRLWSVGLKNGGDWTETGFDVAEFEKLGFKFIKSTRAAGASKTIEEPKKVVKTEAQKAVLEYTEDREWQ